MSRHNQTLTFKLDSCSDGRECLAQNFLRVPVITKTKLHVLSLVQSSEVETKQRMTSVDYSVLTLVVVDLVDFVDLLLRPLRVAALRSDRSWSSTD